MIELKDFIFPVPVYVDENGCWYTYLQDGRINKRTYCSVWFENEKWPGHRLSIHLNKKKIDRSPTEYTASFALHSCDDPACVNPNHLRIGTRSDNQKDSFERNPNHRESVSRTHKGKKRSEEELAKFSETMSRPKTEYEKERIYAKLYKPCIIDGVLYKGRNEASRALGINCHRLGWFLRNSTDEENRYISAEEYEIMIAEIEEEMKELKMRYPDV